MMNNLISVLQRFSREEQGPAAVEYGLLVALIAAVIVATVKALGPTVQDGFCTVLTALGGMCPY